MLLKFFLFWYRQYRKEKTFMSIKYRSTKRENQYNKTNSYIFDVKIFKTRMI